MVWKPHVTVAAVVEQDGRFLLVEERVGNGDLVLNQPAGHLEDQETLIEAVCRETREETAWQFHPEAVTGIYLWRNPNNGRTFLRVNFCGHVSDHDPRQPLDEGIIETHWLSADDILREQQRLRSPLVTRGLQDYLDGTRHPLSVLTHLDNNGETW